VKVFFGQEKEEFLPFEIKNRKNNAFNNDINRLEKWKECTFFSALFNGLVFCTYT
jgi:hypothetical protein